MFVSNWQVIPSSLKYYLVDSSMRATDTVCPPSLPRVAFPQGVSAICLVSLKCLATAHLDVDRVLSDLDGD